MSRSRAPSPATAVGLLAGAALTVGLAACAALVGADFGDEYLRGASDGGATPTTDSGGSPPPGGDDSGGIVQPGHDAGPVVVADGGACPTGLTDCGGLCFDLTTNPAHCGKCSTSCPNDPHGAGVCVTSHCTFACDEGWVECAGGCCAPGTDASSPADAAPPPSDGGSLDPGIACGGAHCPVATNSFCCGRTTGDTCDTNLGDNCPFEIFCDNAAECGGAGVCCYDTPTTQTLCETSCTASQKQMCDPAVSGECTTGGTTCTGTFSPSGQTQYSICQ
jgi:hypothetical protein